MRRKPVYGSARLATGSPLTRGLTSLFLLNEGAGPVYDLLHPNEIGTPTLGVSWGASNAGSGLASSAGAATYVGLRTQPLSFDKPFTVLAIIKPNSLATGGGGGYSASYLNFYRSGVGALRLGTDEGSPGKAFASGTFQSGSGRQTSNVLADNKTAVLVVTSDATAVKIFIDGVQVDDASNGNSTGTVNILLGRDTSTGNPTGLLNLVAVWDGRALAPGDVATISANPYALVTPKLHRTIVHAISTGGGSTVPLFLLRANHIGLPLYG